MEPVLASVIALLVGVGIGLALGRRDGDQRAKAAEAAAQAAEIEMGVHRQRAADLEAQRTGDATVTALIQNLEARVKEFQAKAEQADRERLKADEAIRAQIDQMKEGNAQLVTETTKLAGTLSNAANRGRYGEMQLEQLLSHSGLQEGVHFIKQVKNEDGRFPDFTVNLPGGGEIFIDSKFPFDKFWKAATSDSPDQAHLHRTEHAADLLKHADALSKRGYHHKESSPDFVVLFAPFESILSVALEAEPQLLDKMFAKRVVIATPTTMLALLRTIGYGYSQRDMAENAARIRELAGVFLKRAVTVHGKLEVLGNRLRSTANAYSELVASAENSIFVPARRMVALGVPEPKALTALEADVPMREFQSRAELAGEGDDGFTDLDDQLALTTGDDQ